jgi:hypothetical protein
MTEKQFNTNLESVKVALARAFQVHPSLIRVAIDSSRRLLQTPGGARALSSTDVKLTVEFFVAPSDAAAMQNAVTRVQGDPSELASAVETETSIAVTPALTAPAAVSDQIPPTAAPNTATPTPVPTEPVPGDIENENEATNAAHTRSAFGLCASFLVAVTAVWVSSFC